MTPEVKRAQGQKAFLFRILSLNLCCLLAEEQAHGSVCVTHVNLSWDLIFPISTLNSRHLTLPLPMSSTCHRYHRHCIRDSSRIQGTLDYNFQGACTFSEYRRHGVYLNLFLNRLSCLIGINNVNFKKYKKNAIQLMTSIINQCVP